MEQKARIAVDLYIREAARQAAGRLSAPAIEHFLRTGEETWDGAGSGRFTLAQIEQDAIYTGRAKSALRILFDLLASLLPPEAKTVPSIAPETIQQHVYPMVKGLVQADWQDVVLREITARTFVLTFPGAKAAIEAELSTCYMGAAWQILWVYFGDHGLKPEDIQAECDGVSAGEFAHVGWSAYDTKDSYGDVIVHEAAHLLHYLKPEHYGLRVRRGQQRFVDVEFKHRELFAFACEAYSRVIFQGEDRKARIAFAEGMLKQAFSFPLDCRKEVSDLVITAARARNGWRVIREATVSRPIRRRATNHSQARI